MDHHHHLHDSVTDVVNERLAHEADGPTEDGTSILVAKGVTMVVLCGVSICMGLLPLGLAKCCKWTSSEKMANPRSSTIVGLLLGFGGGVLFCTTFLHMLPEVNENVQALIEQGQLPHLPFSLPEAFVCFGFFVMYLVEECVHTRLRHRQAAAEKSVSQDVNRSTNELVENGHSTLSMSHGHSHGYGHGHSHLPAVMMDEHDDFVISSLRGLLIVLGLSVHELFEGLAIGLESSTSYVWYMFAAVAAHKFVIAFCIGIELIASRTNRFLTVVYVCTFAVVSPMGIGIGMALTGSDTTATSGPLAVILQGIATGTLLYVVFFEILQHHRDGLHQYLSILVGFAVMLGLQIATCPIIKAPVGKNEEIQSGIRSTLPKVGTAWIHTVVQPSSNSAEPGLLTSLLLCFGGGVLLFTTFLHLAPEVRQSVERHQSNGQLMSLGTLSMAELLFCIGFFLVYLVEETVHATLTSKPSEDLLYRTVSVRRCNKQASTSVSTTTISTVTAATSTTTSSSSNSSNRASSWRVGRFKYGEEADEKPEPRPEAKTSANCSMVRQSEVAKEAEVLPALFVRSTNSVESSNEPCHVAGRFDDGAEGNFTTRKSAVPMATSEPTKADTSVRGLLAVVALSFHAIFEGLAVGLEPSISSVVYLAAAIATHKLVIAFCVGMELYVAGASTRTVLGYLSVFSLVTPLGIGVGLALGHFKNDSENLGPTPTILQGMAAGTLLYVVFFEVLARERANDKSGLLQLAAIIVGFMLMLGLQLATAHSHSHSHGHSHGGEHDHEERSKHDHGDDHDHAEHSKILPVKDAIERITESVAEAVTNAIASSTTSSPKLFTSDAPSVRSTSTT